MNYMSTQTRFLKAFCAMLFMQTQTAFSQKFDSKKLFVGYEILESRHNRFRFYNLELGYKLNPNAQMRLVACEAQLNQRRATLLIPGNVGSYKLYELNYDRFMGSKKHWHLSANAAWIFNRYSTPDYSGRINQTYLCVGPQLGYQREDIFKIKHLYIHATLPVRYNISQSGPFNSIYLRNNRPTPASNFWLFVGYRF